MITVVMPTYNQAKFIEESIDSILAQEYKDFELIIVNDGSTDNTEELILKYNDPRIKYIKKENGGTGTALNMGFGSGVGEFETWLASDNILYPNALRDMNLVLCSETCVDFVYMNCTIKYMEADGKTVRSQANLHDLINQTWDKERAYDLYLPGIAFMWKRWLREKAGGFMAGPCEDYEMTCRMIEAGGEFKFINIVGGWHRSHSENLSAKTPHSYVHTLKDENKARKRHLERSLHTDIQK